MDPYVALAALSSPTPVPHVESGLANRVDALAQLESRLRGTKTGLRYNLTTAAAGALSISIVVTALAAGSPLALAVGGGVLGVALWRVRHALRLGIRRGSLEAQIDDLIAEGLPNAADDELKKIGSPSDSDLE